MGNKNFLVSVFMMTYNHEKYIAQAIDSVIMQKTNFDYEIVIGEDCSTDKTREIVLEYKTKYPDKIKLLLQEKNVGAMQNQIDTLKACTGKYIALLEGDDYWTDPYKLQKQVDFLEANPEYSMCFHNVEVLAENNSINKGVKTNLEEREYDGYQILKEWTIPTCSAVFKISYLNKTYYKRALNPRNTGGDIILWLSLYEKGKLFCLQDKMAVYRRHLGGMTHQNHFVELQRIRMKEIGKDFNGKYRNITNTYLVSSYYANGISNIKQFNLAGIVLLFNALIISPKYFYNLVKGTLKKNYHNITPFKKTGI